jgi:hypothetical protein
LGFKREGGGQRKEKRREKGRRREREERHFFFEVFLAFFADFFVFLAVFLAFFIAMSAVTPWLLTCWNGNKAFFPILADETPVAAHLARRAKARLQTHRGHPASVRPPRRTAADASSVIRAAGLRPDAPDEDVIPG